MSELKYLYDKLNFSCKDCDFYNDDEGCKDAFCYGYCPKNDEEDIGSATIRELRLQNGDF